MLYQWYLKGKFYLMVNFYWVCAAGLSVSLSHYCIPIVYSVAILQTPFRSLWKKSYLCNPNLVTFCLFIYRWCGQPLRVMGLGKDGTLHGTYESRLCLLPLGRPVSRKACKKKKNEKKCLDAAPTLKYEPLNSSITVHNI